MRIFSTAGKTPYTPQISKMQDIVSILRIKEEIRWETIYTEQRGVAMEHPSVKDYVKIPKQEYNLLKEVYRTVKRQAFLVRLDESERNLAAGKTKAISVDDFIDAV